MSKIRILCTADLHLGRSSALMMECDEFDASAAGAWDRIVQMAISEEADAVAIAGDVFDGAAGYVESRERFVKGLIALHTKGIPVVAVAGNHDFAVLGLVAHREIPNFHVLGRAGKWESKSVDTASGTVVFVGWSFPGEHVRESQVSRLDPPQLHLPVVGLLHCDTAPASYYHPVSLNDLRGKTGAWILGHIHKGTLLDETVCYPGSPQALDFGPGEQGVHGVRWLEIEGGSLRLSQCVPLSTVRYEKAELVVSCESVREAVDAAIEAAKEKCRELADQESFASVQLRAEVVFEGLSELPFHEMRIERILGTHSVTFTGFRLRRSLDPWSLKDLGGQQAEAARLLLGVRHLDQSSEGGEVQESWVLAAQRLVEQSAADIAAHFARTFGNLKEGGEAERKLPAPEERLALARKLVREELEEMLEVRG